MPNAPQPIVSERLQPIISRSNARVKELRRMFHEAAPNPHHEIAIEGWHLVQEAVNSGVRIATVFFSESAGERAAKLLPQLPKNAATFLLPDEVFASVVPTDTPQGIAAIVQVKKHSLTDVLRGQPALLVVAAGLQDPGNLGTIARSAEAFGATGLILTERTVSAWNWKSLRASAGSLFRLPAVKAEANFVISELKAHGIALLATSSHKGTPIIQADLSRPVAFMVGNEGAGLSRPLLAQADEVVVIPQSDVVESLNAAIAASVMLYEASRQRRQQ